MPFNNMSNNYQASRYIVDADGTTPFATIQSAINQCATDLITSATILIRPGTYTESLVLASGIDLQGSEGEVFVDGIHTPPLHGAIQLSNIKFISATNILDSAVAGDCDIKFYNCAFNCTVGYIAKLDIWAALTAIIIESCTEIPGGSNGIVFNNGASAVEILDSSLGSGAVGARLSGVTRIFNSRISCNIEFVGIAAAQIQDSTVTGAITITTPATANIYNSYLYNPTTALFANTTGVVQLGNVVFDVLAGDAISGIGASDIELGEIVLMNAATISGVVNVTRINQCMAGNFITRGNFHMPETEDTGFGGMITQGGTALSTTPFIHSMGTDNIFLGKDAGNLALTVGNATDNVAVGSGALNSVTTGAHNVALGSAAGTNVTTGSNCILIDAPGIAAETQTIRIGSSQTANYQFGIYQASSGATKEVVWVDSNQKLSSSNIGIVSWVTATASLTAAVNTGYVVNIAVPGLLSIQLPATSVLGDTIEITGVSAGMWSITQGNAADQIFYGNVATTLGVAGHLDATNRYDSVKLVCYANHLWKVTSSVGVLNAL